MFDVNHIITETVMNARWVTK